MTIYNKGINGIMSTNEGREIFSFMSTEEEPKRVLRLVITKITGNPVILNIRLEREFIAEEIPLVPVAGSDLERILELDVSLPVGMDLKGVITPRVMGSQGVVDGWVEYEIAK
jgi:hypothetical protein